MNRTPVGLTRPSIALRKCYPRSSMDARIKSGHDE
jgi:hypothetical protein